MVGRAGGTRRSPDAPPLSSGFTPRAGRSHVAAGHPFAAERRQPRLEVDPGGRICIETRGVVGAKWRLSRGRVQRDLPERHPDIRPALRACVDFPRSGDRARGHGRWAWSGRSSASPLCPERTDRDDWRGKSRPSAGMTRFRFQGHRALGGISAPCRGSPRFAAQDGRVRPIRVKRHCFGDPETCAPRRMRRSDPSLLR